MEDRHCSSVVTVAVISLCTLMSCILAQDVYVVTDGAMVELTQQYMKDVLKRINRGFDSEVEDIIMQIDEFRDPIDIRGWLSEKMGSQYGFDTETDRLNLLITMMIDTMQEERECCGVYGNVNHTRSWAFYKATSRWYRTQTKRSPYIPNSCCKPGGNRSICTGVTDFPGPPAAGPPVPMQPHHHSNPYMFSNGCYDRLKYFAENGRGSYLPLVSIEALFIIIAVILLVTRH